jgi:hypothetical protein
MTSGKTVLVLGGGIGGIVAAMPFKCPAAPNEAAMLLEHDCRRRGVRQDIQIDLYTPEPGPMPVADPAPQIALKPPSMLLHWGKVAYEKYRLWSRF